MLTGPRQYDEIAEKIVKICMPIRQGDVVMVQGGHHNFDFLAAIGLAVRKVGAFPEIRVNSDEYYLRTLTEVPDLFLQQTPDHQMRWLDDVDAIISTDPFFDPRVTRNVPEERRGALRQATRPVQQKTISLQIPWTYVGFPTPGMAEMYGIPFEAFSELFWRAIHVDYAQLADRGRKLSKYLQGAQDVHILSEKGTDLHLSLAGRQVLIDDGVISEEDIANEDVGNNLPCGEVFVAPVETSGEGRAVFDLAFHAGQRIVDLQLEFRGGRVEGVEAAENAQVVRDVITHSPGDKDMLAELGIGTNPAVDRVIGYTLTDEKVCGTIHIAIGGNRMYGGKNESPLHWDFVMMHPTLIADGKVIMERGEFRV